MLVGLEHPASVHGALLKPVLLVWVMLMRCGRAALWTWVDAAMMAAILGRCFLWPCFLLDPHWAEGKTQAGMRNTAVINPDPAGKGVMWWGEAAQRVVGALQSWG